MGDALYAEDRIPFDVARDMAEFAKWPLVSGPTDGQKLPFQHQLRAQMIAGNRRVAPQKRAEKEEIRQWFRVWLETPEAFFDWLELRKRAPEFVERFGPAPAESGEVASRE